MSCIKESYFLFSRIISPLLQQVCLKHNYLPCMDGISTVYFSDDTDLFEEDPPAEIILLPRNFCVNSVLSTQLKLLQSGGLIQ
jgi:hypothetical protein